MSNLREIQTRHARYQDSLVETFESHLRDLVLRAEAEVIALLRRRLAISGDSVDQTTGNLRVMRGASRLFEAILRRAGYDRLVNAFVAEFAGTLPFLQEVLEYLASNVKTPWPAVQFTARDLNLLGAVQANTATAIEDAVSSVSNSAMSRSMFSVGGLQFGDLVESITTGLDQSIGRARTIADTGMSTFYRTATDRAFQAIEKDLPRQTLRYRYAGPDDKLTRPFCRRLMESGRSYTREQIDGMDNGSLPNVWLSCGGWNCRHSWLLDVSEIEVRAAEAA